MRHVLFTLTAILLAGCTGSEGMTPAAIRPAVDEAGPLSPETYRGAFVAALGAEVAGYSGCEGWTVAVMPPGDPAPVWTYPVPEGARSAAVVADARSGAAPAAIRVCVFGLAAGTYSVVGQPPLEMKLDFSNETSVDVVLWPANQPPSAMAGAEFEVTITPSRES